MSSKKMRKSSPTMSSELVNARARLEGVLQQLVERSESSTSVTSSEDEDTLIIPDLVPPEMGSQSKRSHRKQRKRRRRDEYEIRVPRTQKQPVEYPIVCVAPRICSVDSHIFKLYDHTIDLSQFDESTPLYTLCRTWINNGRAPSPAANSSPNTTPPVVIKEEPQENLVYSLPAPLQIKTESRVPSPIPNNSQDFVVDSDGYGPSKETLFKEHMNRWKTIRLKWKKAMLNNEARYYESGAIIRAMYESALACMPPNATQPDPMDCGPASSAS